MGAERAQECVALTSHDFTSMIYYVQFEVPSYDRWVMDCDMHSALKWHPCGEEFCAYCRVVRRNACTYNQAALTDLIDCGQLLGQHNRVTQHR